MIDINFLSQRRLTLTKIEKADKKVLNIGLIFFSVAVICFVVIFGVSLYFQNSLKRTSQEQANLQQRILDEEPTEVAFLIFANKLKTIKGLFDSRSDKQEAIGFFSQLFGPKVFIGGMEYNDKASILSLKTTSNHIFDLDTTFGLLESEEVNSKFSSLEKTTLSRKNDGSYSFQLLIGLKKNNNDTKK